MKGLPPATVITAEIDPLKSEGQQYAERLTADGAEVAYRHVDGVAHEFFGAAAVVDEAKAAQPFAAERLRAAFAK